jgi:hypothetical protein
VHQQDPFGRVLGFKRATPAAYLNAGAALWPTKVAAALAAQGFCDWVLLLDANMGDIVGWLPKQLCAVASWSARKQLARLLLEGIVVRRLLAALD